MKTTNSLPDSKPCNRCKGTAIDSYVWNGKDHAPGPCARCDATGHQSKPDFGAILDLITKKSKDGKIAFRKSKPDLQEFKIVLHGQAYFVWRMVRFHGGADVTMPMIAGLCVRNDSYYDELDQFACLLAKHFMGTDMAAAYRWARALGHSVSVPDSMPASAFPCGPVADEHKPEQEMMELR